MSIHAKDVGIVYGILLSETMTDPWTPSKIVVTKAGKEEHIFFPKGG